MLMISVPAVLFALVGCKPHQERFCERLDECNALERTSVDECSNSIEDALADLSDSDEEDCRTAIDTCLQNESCDNFAVCVLTDASPKCGTYYTFTTVTVTTTDPGGGGGGGGGGATDCETGADAFCFCLPYYYTDYYCDAGDVADLVQQCEDGTPYGLFIECFADFVDGNYVDCYGGLTGCG